MGLEHQFFCYIHFFCMKVIATKLSIISDNVILQLEFQTSIYFVSLIIKTCIDIIIHSLFFLVLLKVT